jgi:hypothetical protein
MSPPKAIQQKYRFALYGAQKSGKTSILCALALPRVAHPDGFSCTWLESLPGNPLPPGNPDSWTTSDPYHLGWRWISEQKELLRQGKVPEPNQNREPMRFLFDFGAPMQGTRHIELIDYSGELITASESELAGRLRDHMRECNGLLILAEVPNPNDEQSRLIEDLEKLSGAFRQLLNEREDAPLQEWPIVLLFNKWDRRETTGRLGRDSQVARSLVDEFLKQSPPPPHASMLDTIRNAVGKENLHCQPVSAFGSHTKRDDGTESPCLIDGRLQSFGLEDGFIWLAQRCDSLRVNEIETIADSIKWWHVQSLLFGRKMSDSKERKTMSWKGGLGVSPVSGFLSAGELSNRFPQGSDFGVRCKRVMNEFAFKTATQSLSLATVLLLFFVIAESLWDGVQYRNIIATKDDPSASVEDLRRGEAWLEKYFSAPSFLHMVLRNSTLDRTQSQSLLRDLRNRRDESMWNPVIEAETPETRVSLAERYVEEFPNGAHKPEAERLVEESRKRKQEFENQSYLTGIDLRIEQIQTNSKSAIQELNSRLDELNAIPHPDAQTQAVTEFQNKLRDSITRKKEEISQSATQADWQKFKQAYVAYMQNGDVAEAARLLDGAKKEEAEYQELLNGFRENAPAAITKTVREKMKNRSWTDARKPIGILSNPNALKILTPDAIAQIRKLDEEINEEEDRDLYAQILRYKPQCYDQITTYLSRAPLKTMQPPVEAYREYLVKMRNTLPLKLKLTGIQWDSKYWSMRYAYKNEITVNAMGNRSIVAAGISSKANTTTSGDWSSDINLGINDPINIEVTIVAKYGWAWSSSMSGGKGDWSGMVDQLRSGISIDLPGDGFKNTANLVVDGFPTEPELPAWNR